MDLRVVSVVRCLSKKKYPGKGALSIFSAGTALIAVYHIVIALLLRVPGADVAKSLLMQLGGILLPGISLFALLYKKKQSLLGALCISYILGYATNIASYFLLVPFGLLEIVPIYAFALAIGSVVVLFWKRAEIELAEEANKALYWIGFMIVLLANTIVYACANVSPEVNGSSWIPTDLLFWIENSSALAGQFPTHDPRVLVDKTLYYHYFSSIQIAFLNLATGVDCFTLSVPLYAIGKTIILYGAAYVLFSGVTKNNWIRIFGILAVFFGSALENVTVTTYVCHIWTHPFGFDIGFAFGMFFLHCFYMQWKQEKLDGKVLMLSIIALAVCSGAKMPIAVVVIAAAGIICFCWLFQGKFKLALSYGCSLLAIFIVIAVFCAGVGISGAENRLGGFTLWGAIRDNSPVLTQLYEWLPTQWSQWIKLLVMVLAYFICAGCITFGLLFLVIPFVVFDKKLRTAQNFGLLFAAVLGMGLGIFNTQSGNSQMYFTMSAVIPCILLGVIWLDSIVLCWKNVAKKAVAVLVSLGLMVQMLCCLLFGWTYWGRGLAAAAYRGLSNIAAQTQDIRTDSIQQSDLEALAWIRDNTPKDSVLLSDRCVVGNMEQYMYYGTFSERQMYLEGDIYYRQTFLEERARIRAIIHGVFDNSSEALSSAIDDGVDYVVQTVWLTPGFVVDTQKLVLVFSSETINVYEVVK